eukprot:TRINITY_DN7549_c0_g1_i2.p1 TRINITY_DN7549_c0_g1~~TRINITY_DN7549_c0_g1_i2.p1  ORF type:complete len:335 (-),score=76.50 TRINITY_DN7549_c0_g1_i2:12-875(-)
MFPASKAVPKALFPVVDIDGMCKPVIQIIIDEALSALGEDAEICIVVQPGQEDPIKEFFSESDEVYHKKPELKEQIERLKYIGKRIKFAYQEKQEGFGHAVLCAKDFVGDEPFLVLLGDHVYTTDHPQEFTCTKQIVEVYNKHGISVTSLGICQEDSLSVNGIATGKLDENDKTLYHLTKTEEKPSVDFAKEHLKAEGVPEGSYLCYFGIDLVTPRLFSILEDNYKNNRRTKGELQLRDAMGTLMKEEGMYGLKVVGNRHDTGMPEPYADTIRVFDALARKKKKDIK